MIEESEFRSHKILILKRKNDDKFPFQFGLGKARMIVEHFDKIKEFVDKNKNAEM